jgi:hypothetical protein
MAAIVLYTDSHINDLSRISTEIPPAERAEENNQTAQLQTRKQK